MMGGHGLFDVKLVQMAPEMQVVNTGRVPHRVHTP